MDDRKKTLELFAKQLSEGLPFAEDFIKGDADIENNSLLARNLSEDALAHQALKNTALSVPNNNAPVRQREDFLNRLAAERYPEIRDPKIRIGAEDSYSSGTGGILVRDRGDIVKEAGKVFHESAHKYDNDVLGFKGKELDLKTLRDAKKSGLDLKNMDPAEVYNLYANKHHARIPNLRDADSFGIGALKSIMKSGNFKQLAGALPLAGTAMALSSGDVQAAAEELPSEIPVVGQAYDAIRSESAGNSQDDKDIINEVRARKSYDNSPASTDLRQKALMALTKK